MKKFSSRYSIAVHILSLIALSPTSCTSDFIAESVNTNPVIIRRIIGMLKKAGLVHVRAGAGGTYLQKGLDEITLLDVYKAVEVADNEDIFNFHDETNPQCPVGANIESIFRTKMLQAQSAMEHELAQVTLKHLVSELKEKTGSI
ncbi:Rrf2 family transcriptional regulator [Alkalihalophilus marmarensis]|uniref:Rrf2 family transcriptional regulator n=1 Tax=Alkalihalophilus marmarensis TaxID=521377 RepID=UPI00203A6839|nr:Rrf2 family transcriptional regulator [Alkalihalophilus marmarensis]MCM3491228.1 Rrf2 family transcriptional regulator [Alkalihalophilus marmarensis]